MPSTKKRINLTVPDAVYQQLRIYMQNNFIENDATACLQLIKMQLKAQENGNLLMNVLRQTSAEQLAQISAEGFQFVKDKLPELEKKK